MFNISFWRLTELLLPFSLRSMSILALLRSAFTPWEHGLSGRFEQARQDDMFDLRHNGQVCYLRAALNAKFRSSSGIRFEIEDIHGDAQWVYIGSDSDLVHRAYITDEQSGHDMFFIPDESVLDPRNTFVVYVPEDLYHNNLPAIKRFVNKYRLVTRVPLYKPRNN